MEKTNSLGPLERTLIGVALALFALRFARLDLAPFILDEPMLQLKLDEHFRAGTLPTFGLLGTHGVDYGPTALWFYAPVRLLTDSVTLIIAAHALYFTLGWALVYLAVKRRVGSVAAAWSLALAASSPYYFIYSRSAWDNTFQVLTTGLIAYGASRITRARAHLGLSIGIGAACGLTFGVHLMSVPVLAAAAWVLFSERDPSAHRMGLARIAMLAVGFFAVAAPYLAVVLPELRHGEGNHFAITREGFLRSLPKTFIASGRYLSAFKFDYFFSDLTQPVKSLTWIDPAWVLRIAGWSFLFSRLAWIARRQAMDPVTRLAALCFALLLIYYFGVRPDMYHPHYVMPTAWIIFVAAGSAIQGARGRLQSALKGFAVATIAVNVTFILAVGSVIAERHGIRGEHYGPAQVETSGVISNACGVAARSGAQVLSFDLKATPGLFSQSIRYLFAHDENCRGLRLVDKAEPGSLAFSTRYAESPKYSARLVLIQNSSK